MREKKEETALKKYEDTRVKVARKAIKSHMKEVWEEQS